jgi:hypothetical protein
MNDRRNLRAPALLIAALAALLIFAAAASAETRTGETTTAAPLFGVASPEATLVKSSASYETTGGTVGFSFTTAAEPQAEKEGEPSDTVTDLALISATSGCSFTAVEFGQYSSPLLAIESHYDEPAIAKAAVATSIESLPAFSIPVGKTVSGTTTTLALTLGQVANQSFNCALVETQEEAGASLMVFPIAAPVIPPETPAPPAAPTPSAAVPASAPPVLAIAKAKKPLSLKVGKSKTVKIKVSNTGATATAQGSLRVKPTKGVLVTPETQKLPVLAPGASWTISVRVKLTEKAKPKSTLSLTGTASGLTAKGSLVVKLKE